VSTRRKQNSEFLKNSEFFVCEWGKSHLIKINSTLSANRELHPTKTSLMGIINLTLYLNEEFVVFFIYKGRRQVV